MATRIGTAAQDTLFGTLGNDFFDGLESADTYVIGPNSGFDTYADSGSTGADRIIAQTKNMAIGLASGFGPGSGIEEISANGFAKVSISGGSTNDVFDFSTILLTGIFKIVGGPGSDSITGSGGNNDIRGNNGSDHLWGGAGDDALYGGDLNDLDPVSDAQHGADGQDVLDGGEGNDMLAGGSGSDALSGSAGSDTLLGGASQDTLTGGTGTDDFVFLAESDSGPATGRDTIGDFVRGQDVIVLTAIDANTILAGDQAFALDTNGSFSTGEIRQIATTGGLLLEFNTDADTGAEMAILLKAFTGQLSSTDFEL